MSTPCATYSTGHACLIILESPKTNPANDTESTQKIYMRISFLLSGSVTDVIKFDFRSENLQPGYISPLPYGGYLLASSIMRDNQKTHLVRAYVNNGVNGEMKQIDIPSEIPITDSFGIFPNNTFWAYSIATGKNWSYVTSK